MVCFSGSRDISFGVDFRTYCLETFALSYGFCTAQTFVDGGDTDTAACLVFNLVLRAPEIGTLSICEGAALARLDRGSIVEAPNFEALFANRSLREFVVSTGSTSFGTGRRGGRGVR